MRSLFTYWHLDLLMAVFLLTICIGYFYLTGFTISRKLRYFFAGYCLVVLSVASPLHFLGENYLMSAHMLSHVILLLIAAPLLVMGIPDNLDNTYLKSISERMAKTPWLAWLAGVLIMWFWHIPVIFNSLFKSSDPGSGNFIFGQSILQNLHLISLIIAGIIFSWPVVGPITSRRIPPLQAVLYLSSACIFCSVLGLLITFAPTGVYTGYLQMQDHFGFLKIIRNENGISPLIDQQIAGLIMWVPGCLIYLSASMLILFKWFRGEKGKPVFITHNNHHDGKSN